MARCSANILTVMVCFMGCATRPSPLPLEQVAEFAPSQDVLHPGLVGCEAMFDEYCNSLFSPEARGNLKIGKVKKGVFTVFRGSTRNDFSATFFFYANAKLKHRDLLPLDFREDLESHGYFKLLGEYLNRDPRATMYLTQRLKDIRTELELNAFWESAIEGTVLRRMQKIHPKIHQLRDEMIPIELKWEMREQKRELISEISMALWKDNENWKKVEHSFREVKEHFLVMVRQLAIPEETRKRWLARVAQVQVVLPGSYPETADEECSTTETNAYYSPRLNVITVCAGDFNSEDIYQTLSHELAHSIDVTSLADSERYVSDLGLEILRLRESSCAKKSFQCENWNLFKSKFQDRLMAWRGYSVDVPQFQRCLKPSATTPFTETAIETVASDAVSELFAGLAESNAFVRLTKERVPWPDGTWTKNESYLDACRRSSSRTPPDPLDEEEDALLFFVSEYRCSEGSSVDRLKQSIGIAKGLVFGIAKESIRMEGEFSPNPGMKRSGFSSTPIERFADVLGSYALARILNDSSDTWYRRKLYLASSSWQCTKPSLSKAFPDESRIEKDLTFDIHAFAKERQRESFSVPVRQALNCDKDFEFSECSLLPMVSPAVRRPAPK